MNIGLIKNMYDKIKDEKSSGATEYTVRHNRRGEEVYRMEFHRDNYQITLYHYETKTLQLQLSSNSQPVIADFYGESKSDADSMNTLLHLYYDNCFARVPGKFRYGPVMGFVFDKGDVKIKVRDSHLFNLINS
ncbi:hypothetical protein KLEB273_gp130 [Bacillus phage vB_BauM_KLEB27-3]|nr:hypothetical protein KLEB273_gp130 [Bacillus phage vB_BauM_KLEB27-3]